MPGGSVFPAAVHIGQGRQHTVAAFFPGLLGRGGLAVGSGGYGRAGRGVLFPVAAGEGDDHPSKAENQQQHQGYRQGTADKALTPAPPGLLIKLTIGLHLFLLYIHRALKSADRNNIKWEKARFPKQPITFIIPRPPARCKRKKQKLFPCPGRRGLTAKVRAFIMNRKNM